MIGRREFIVGLGGATAWPVVARAQQPTVPVVGMLSLLRADSPATQNISAVRRGLREAGFIEGRNVAIEYRFAEGEPEQFPGLAADLVRRQVAVIVALTLPAALAAKDATQSIPIAFMTGGDPVALGLVSGLSRPQGNLTGFSNLGSTVLLKRLEVLRELVPTATAFGFLVNPANPGIAEAETRQMQIAADALRVRLVILRASNSGELDAAFTKLAAEQAGGLAIGADALFVAEADRLIALAAHYRMPTAYSDRRHAKAGGLVSYGTNLVEAYRDLGIYTGRLLKGANPADLPVEQATRIELVINLKTARALGLNIPEALLAIADEVIQ